MRMLSNILTKLDILFIYLHIFVKGTRFSEPYLNGVFTDPSHLILCFILSFLDKYDIISIKMFINIFQEFGFNRMNTNEALPSPVGQRLPGYAEFTQVGVRQFPPDRKWALGLQVSF